MSKVKKVTRKKIAGQRLSNHYSSLSLINQNQTLGSFLQKPDKPDLPHSESPYAKRIPISRSHSTLKDTQINNLSGLVSPPLNSKFTMNLKSKVNLNSTYISKLSNPNDSRMHEIKNAVFMKRNSRDSDTFLLEVKMEELYSQHKENGISERILDCYIGIFEEIISKDKIFGSLLNRIKTAYNDWIKFQSNISSENYKLRAEVLEINKKITEEVDFNKRLHKKIQKFSRENVELGRALEEKDNNMRSVQEYLMKITNISIEEIPQDTTSWKVLIAENSSYSEQFSKLKKRIKQLKQKESVLMKLYCELEEKGYPIQEILNSFECKPTEKSTRLFPDDYSDSDPISIIPAKQIKKPSAVPMLTMTKVDPNSFSDDRNSDEDDSS